MTWKIKIPKELINENYKEKFNVNFSMEKVDHYNKESIDPSMDKMATNANNYLMFIPGKQLVYIKASSAITALSTLIKWMDMIGNNIPKSSYLSTW